MMMLETPGLQTVRTERRADSRPDSRGEQGHRLFRAAHRQPRNTHRGRNAQRTHTRQSIAPISTVYSAQKEKPSQSAGRTQEVRLKSALDWRPQEPLAYAAGQKTFWDKGRRTYHLTRLGAQTIIKSVSSSPFSFGTFSSGSTTFGLGLESSLFLLFGLESPSPDLPRE